MQMIERQLVKMRKHGPAAAQAQKDESPSIRFRPEGLKKHRQRLGMSAADLAKILGCSSLSVYKWESGKTRPRPKQLAAIAELRKMGKKDAAKRLEDVAQ